MASSYQDLLTEVWRVIEDDSGSSFVPAATPFSAELIPATMQGREFTAWFDGGSVGLHAATSSTSHALVVEVLADTRIPKTGQAIALSYVTALAEALAPGGGNAPLGEHGARAVFQDYDLEPVNGGEWTVIRVNFEVVQIAALES